ncbi:MAG: hypothetical protein M3Y35_04505 [Actinomycetota bacterium]|nr:hypothetical protein [Actinomycetota bacterium]
MVAASAPTYEYFWCGTQISETDSNGTFNLNRLCSGLNQIRWTYQIGPISRSIIVGNVVERGLDFWIDGQPQSRNATHTEPAGYFFHGTMSKITT